MGALCLCCGLWVPCFSEPYGLENLGFHQSGLSHKMPCHDRRNSELPLANLVTLAYQSPDTGPALDARPTRRKTHFDATVQRSGSWHHRRLSHWRRPDSAAGSGSSGVVPVLDQDFFKILVLFWGPLNTSCGIMGRSPEGTTILTTTHLHSCGPHLGDPEEGMNLNSQKSQHSDMFKAGHANGRESRGPRISRGTPHHQLSRP